MIRVTRLGGKQTLAIGFVVIILTGALLLMLPVANKNGEFLPFLDALFTSTSATCVTGLVVYDTWSQFTLFGQVVFRFLQIKLLNILQKILTNMVHNWFF